MYNIKNYREIDYKIINNEKSVNEITLVIKEIDIVISYFPWRIA